VPSVDQETGLIPLPPTEDKSNYADMADKAVKAAKTTITPDPIISGYFYDVQLGGRICNKCKVILREGYLSELIHPSDGAWDLDGEYSAWVGSQMIDVDPNAHKTFEAMDNFLKRIETTPAPQPITAASISVRGLYNEVIEIVDQFPATNLFLIVLTALMIIIFIKKVKN
jgi:hypothetical protein